MEKISAKQKRASRRAQATLDNIDFGAMFQRLDERLARRSGRHTAVWIMLNTLAPDSPKPKGLY